MKLSEQEIEMFKQAEEIQKAWKIQEGDRYAKIVGGEVKSIKYYVDEYNKSQNQPVFVCDIWIPYQHQLQAILIKELGNTLVPEQEHVSLINQMHCFLFGDGKGNSFEEISKKARYSSQFKTMDELWLAFTMATLYNKIWNGQIWEKRE